MQRDVNLGGDLKKDSVAFWFGETDTKTWWCFISLRNFQGNWNLKSKVLRNFQCSSTTYILKQNISVIIAANIKTLLLPLFYESDSKNRQSCNFQSQRPPHFIIVINFHQLGSSHFHICKYLWRVWGKRSVNTAGCSAYWWFIQSHYEKTVWCQFHDEMCSQVTVILLDKLQIPLIFVS